MYRLFAAAILFAPVAASAAPVELVLPGQVQRTSVAYSCSDGVDRTADYINVGENSLAVVDIDGAPIVFVNVMSGSGARYMPVNVNQTYELLTKGDAATLYEDSDTVLAGDCTAKR